MPWPVPGTVQEGWFKCWEGLVNRLGSIVSTLPEILILYIKSRTIRLCFVFQHRNELRKSGQATVTHPPVSAISYSRLATSFNFRGVSDRPRDVLGPDSSNEILLSTRLL
jgi:hypothetical protein